MHPRPFTSKTRVALAIARGIAAARGDRDITPTHIAAGIFREGSNLGLAALWYAGLSETAIKTLGGEFERSLPKPPGDVQPRQVTVDLTAGEAVITNQAELEMDRLEDPYLGTEPFSACDFAFSQRCYGPPGATWNHSGNVRCRASGIQARRPAAATRQGRLTLLAARRHKVRRVTSPLARLVYGFLIGAAAAEVGR